MLLKCLQIFRNSHHILCLSLAASPCLLSQQLSLRFDGLCLLLSTWPSSEWTLAWRTTHRMPVIFPLSATFIPFPTWLLNSSQVVCIYCLLISYVWCYILLWSGLILTALLNLPLLGEYMTFKLGFHLEFSPCTFLFSSRWSLSIVFLPRVLCYCCYLFLKSANILSVFCDTRKQQALGREQWAKHTSLPQESDIHLREVTKDFDSYNRRYVLIHYSESNSLYIKAQREYGEFISFKGFL